MNNVEEIKKFIESNYYLHNIEIKEEKTFYEISLKFYEDFDIDFCILKSISFEELRECINYNIIKYFRKDDE